MSRASFPNLSEPLNGMVAPSSPGSQQYIHVTIQSGADLLSPHSPSSSTIDSPTARVVPLSPNNDKTPIVAISLTSSAPPLPWLPTLSAILLAGILFGIGLERSAVFQPDVIRDQLVFKRWLVACSCVSFIP
jgi:hypothetical protein